MQVHAKIQKWGNGLGLRVSGVLRDLPQFSVGTEVDVDITEHGFTVSKVKPKKQNILRYTEAELLMGMTPEKIHADLLAQPTSREVG
jgi:antitoxin MazE